MVNKLCTSATNLSHVFRFYKVQKKNKENYLHLYYETDIPYASVFYDFFLVSILMRKLGKENWYSRRWFMDEMKWKFGGMNTHHHTYTHHGYLNVL